MSTNASSLHGRDDHAPLFALPRGSALVHLKVGTASRRRPIFAAKPPLYPQTATASPESWVRSASRPYQFFTKGAAAPIRATART